MGTSSGANFDQQGSPKMLPPRQHPRSLGLQTSLSLASSDAFGSHEMQELLSNSDQGHDSPSDSTSSRETWPVETVRGAGGVNGKTAFKEKEGESEFPETQVIRRVSIADKLSLREVARERVEVIADRMTVMPGELLEELKAELRAILEGTGGPHIREEFSRLQQFVQGRGDLTAKTLVRAHRVQLEILVAINTGILAFLHPNVSLPQSRLVEIFLYKRCRNIACQSPIPADDCTCEICTRRNGFCNLCMCVVCNKFDFEVNTYRWIGCDFCAHWTHAECAMRIGQIGMGASAKSGMGHGEMLFRCLACNRTSELLGWVKDVFQHCAPGWDREALFPELEFVSGIFHLSEDPRGRKLCRKCSEIIEKMKSGASKSTACRMLLLVFQGIYTAHQLEYISNEICCLTLSLMHLIQRVGAWGSLRQRVLNSKGVKWPSLRPIYIYGPLNYNPVEEWFFHRLKAGRPIPIPNSGVQIIQLGHVKLVILTT